MGKYQLDTKGKLAVAKYHEKRKPSNSDKTQKIEQLKANYLKKKHKKSL